jgi:hypothetical protein
MNRSLYFYYFTALCALFAGVILFAIMNNWLIIRIPGIHGFTHYSGSPFTHTKKQITLHFYGRDAWHHENIDILWSNQKGNDLRQLVCAWLTTLEEEKILAKKVILEAIAFDAKKTTAYLSFDRIPFAKGNTIFQKWMLLEGLLKTILQSEIAITHFFLLVHHQTIQDPHLDLSRAWPITGFMRN